MIVDDLVNVEVFDYVKVYFVDGMFVYVKDVGVGWGGEVFGKEFVVMVIEGNWIIGVLLNDYSSFEYIVVEFFEGFGGKGML